MTDSRSEYLLQLAEARYEALYGPVDLELDEEEVQGVWACQTHAGGFWEGFEAFDEDGEAEPVCSAVVEGSEEGYDEGGSEPCWFEEVTT